MGWPEEPDDLGAPGHANRSDEIEALRDQIFRLSKPVAGIRYINGATIAAGVSTTEVFSNVSTGVGRFEAGRRYKIKMKLHIQMSATTNVAVFRARVGSVTGTQIDYFQVQAPNTGLGFWHYMEMDFCPSTDITDSIVLTMQIASGGGTVDLEDGNPGSPLYFEVWDAGHLTDVTTIS